MNQRGQGAMIYHGTTPVTEIVLHCSATRPDWMAGHSLAAKVAEIDRWHRDRNFSQVGYHWIIDRDGKFAAGRPETKVGAHVKGRNTGTIGICLLGGFGGSADDDFDDHYTPQQRATAWRLIRAIADRTDIRRVTGHNQYAAKSCPCFRASAEFPWPPPFEEDTSPLGRILAALWGILKSILERFRYDRKA